MKSLPVWSTAWFQNLQREEASLLAALREAGPGREHDESEKLRTIKASPVKIVCRYMMLSLLLAIHLLQA